MIYFSIKNFDKFQHYKDRNPPWIKLHNCLLEDYDFSCLQDASKLHLILIWMLASRMENKIPLDPEWIKIKLNLDKAPDIKLLIDKGFLVCDSDVLAGCLQDAIPEREGETEKRREEKRQKRLSPDDFPLPDFVDRSLWIDFMEVRKKLKAVQSESALKSIVKKLEAMGTDANEALANSIEASWKTVYPIKNSKTKQSGNDPFDKLCSQLGVVPYDQYPEWDDPLISKALFKAGSWMSFSRMPENKQKFEFRPKFIEAYKSLGG